MNQTNPHPILCATDFSAAAAQAGNVAAAFAVRLHVPLLLVHGVDERSDLAFVCWPSMMELSRAPLQKEAERLRTLGANVEEVVAGRGTENGVVHFAERANARLIVLASSNHGTLGRWTLGSFPEDIAESAWVPTLVLQQPTRMEDWAHGGKPLRVFVAADFTNSSDAALAWAAQLREIGPCEFTVGFVDRLAEEPVSEAATAPTGTPEPLEMREMMARTLRERAENFLPGPAVHVDVQPASGPVAAQLLKLAKETRADLVVVGTHQWHGVKRLRHSSVSRGVLHASETSVACVPAHRVISATSPCFSKVHRVLVATDLSTHGGGAIPYAFSMLQRGGTAWLLHVSPPGEASDANLDRLRELILVEALEQGFQVRTEVVTSEDVAGAICAAALRLDADFICLGARSPSESSPAPLGATTLGVLERSSRPVLVVPQRPS